MKRGSSLSRGSGAQLSDSWDMACTYTTHHQREERTKTKGEERRGKEREGGREDKVGYRGGERWRGRG